MDEVKFAHISDTHLGARNFKLKEREEDFYKAFERSIEEILKENVDFVVHSGDLFERASPSISSVLIAIENLKKLRENEIPLFIVPGNHDIYLNETFLSVLERLSLLKNLGSKRYFKKEGDFIVCRGETFGKVFLCGVPGRRVRIKDIYSKLVVKFPEDCRFKIFLFHHIVNSVTSRFPDIDINLLPKGFDYYAGGHWHSRFEDVGRRVFYPGSTEFWDLSEMKKDKEKGFFIVRLFEGGNERKWVKTNVREIKIKDVPCPRKSIIELNSDLIEAIRREYGKGEIMIIRVFGRLRDGNRNRINRNYLEELGKKMGYLYVYIDDSELENPEEEFVECVREKTLEEIELEYLEKKFDSKEIEVAKMLMDLLGRDIKPLEMISLKRKIVEEIKKTFDID